MLKLPSFVVYSDVTCGRQEGKHHELLMEIYCLNGGIQRISQHSHSKGECLETTQSLHDMSMVKKMVSHVTMQVHA